MDVERLWAEATDLERRVIVEELLESVTMYPDHLEVTVSGVPRLKVTLEEVGLTGGGSFVVSEGRAAQSAPLTGGSGRGRHQSGHGRLRPSCREERQMSSIPVRLRVERSGREGGVRHGLHVLSLTDPVSLQRTISIGDVASDTD
jgi:hypothetical protein